MLKELKWLLFGHWLDSKTMDEIDGLASNNALTISDMRYLCRNQEYFMRVAAKAAVTL